MTLDDLFLLTLKDIYFAERQILAALPKMAKAAQSDQLKQAFIAHREETEGQVERLQAVFEALGKRAQGTSCEGIKGIIEECEELLDGVKEPSPVRDAGLIAWSTAAGKGDVVALLQSNLDQEKKADTLLTRLSNAINSVAATAA